MKKQKYKFKKCLKTLTGKHLFLKTQIGKKWSSTDLGFLAHWENPLFTYHYIWKCIGCGFVLTNDEMDKNRAGFTEEQFS